MSSVGRLVIARTKLETLHGVNFNSHATPCRMTVMGIAGGYLAPEFNGGVSASTLKEPLRAACPCCRWRKFEAAMPAINKIDSAFIQLIQRFANFFSKVMTRANHPDCL
jgi:hypothetical protein